MRFFTISSLLLLITGCAANISQSQCDAAVRHTALENKEFHVFIYHPDSEITPEVWEGPICGQAKRLGTVCYFDESLIKRVQFADAETLWVTTFSGSNVKEWSFNLSSCQKETL